MNNGPWELDQEEVKPTFHIVVAKDCDSFTCKSGAFYTLHKETLQEEIHDQKWGDGQQSPGQTYGLIQGAPCTDIIGWIQLIEALNEGLKPNGESPGSCSRKQRQLRCLVPEPDEREEKG